MIISNAKSELVVQAIESKNGRIIHATTNSEKNIHKKAVWDLLRVT